MQNVDCFLELGDIHHTVDSARVVDANFSSTGPHILERLPSGILLKCDQILVGGSYPTDLFFISH